MIKIKRVNNRYKNTKDKKLIGKERKIKVQEYLKLVKINRYIKDLQFLILICNLSIKNQKENHH